MKQSEAYNTTECQSTADRLVLSEIDNRFASARTKSDVIKALENNYLLCRIPLLSPVVTMEQAHKDFERERVLLNDVAFIPDIFDVNRCHAFSVTLSVLLERLMKNKDAFNKDHYENAGEIADAILQRACRTAAGSDSYFKIQQLLCVENTVITQKTFLHDPPIRVDVFIVDYSSSEDIGGSSIGSETTGESRGSDYEEVRMHSICSRILVQNSFSIFDASSIDLFNGDTNDDPTPWLEVEATVVDEVNYRTNEQDRALQLLVTCPETGAVYQSASHAPYHFNSGSNSNGHSAHNLSFHGTPMKPPRSKGVLSEISSFLTSASPRRPSASTPTPTPQAPVVSSMSQSHHGVASLDPFAAIDNSNTQLDD